MTSTTPTLRQRWGCWAHERRPTELVLRTPRLGGRLGLEWLDLCNRNERLTVDETTGGRICHWADSSPLTVTRFFPRVGSRLLKHCLKEWPIEFDTADEPRPVGGPDISIIIAVRGTGRLPQFRACLATLRAQQGVDCEIIVVEQSRQPQFGDIVPADVPYLHQPTPHVDMPFNKSWALNAGVHIATGEILIIWDADMLAPARLAEAVAARIQSGLDAVRLPRFLFYLERLGSTDVWTHRCFDRIDQVKGVVQNTPNPLAVTRDAYLSIGGHDESFYGWGGEDNEFLDRLRTLCVGEGGFLPIIHLWHPEAPNRGGDRNAALLAQRLKVPSADRIQQLATKAFGRTEPALPWEPACVGRQQETEVVTSTPE